MASTFRNIYYVGTEFGTNQRYFVLKAPSNKLRDDVNFRK